MFLHPLCSAIHPGTADLALSCIVPSCGGFQSHVVALQAAVTVLLEPKRKDFLEMMVTFLVSAKLMEDDD